VIVYRINPSLTNEALNELFASAWDGHAWVDFGPQLELSLLYVAAFADARLIGFVKVVWDGGVHAFLLDTSVHRDFQRRGIGRELVTHAIAASKERGCHWMHVDFEPHLEPFYADCGFQPTLAGLVNLR
jgi:ribosomal protein S18 acetylase RimI-like enzyme